MCSAVRLYSHAQFNFYIIFLSNGIHNIPLLSAVSEKRVSAPQAHKNMFIPGSYLVSIGQLSTWKFLRWKYISYPAPQSEILYLRPSIQRVQYCACNGKSVLADQCRHSTGYNTGIALREGRKTSSGVATLA